MIPQLKELFFFGHNFGKNVFFFFVVGVGGFMGVSILMISNLD